MSVTAVDALNRFLGADPDSVTVNLPRPLAQKLALISVRTGVSEQALIIDLLEDSIDRALLCATAISER